MLIYEVAGLDGSVLVCLFFKSLYGLKQLGRIWNQTFDSFLVKFELEPIDADQCVYILKNDPALIIALFVDDRLAYYSSHTKLTALITYIE